MEYWMLKEQRHFRANKVDQRDRATSDRERVGRRVTDQAARRRSVAL